MKFLFCLIALVAVAEARPNKYERMKEVFEYIQTNETLLAMYKEHQQQYAVAREHYMNNTKRQVHSFSCHLGYDFSTSQATSVHQLRPEDIAVVAALGDSLTAGNGILGTNILDCLKEYRGRSWSIGGDLNFDLGVETIPNILRKFRPHLKGASIDKCSAENVACSQLNVAVAGETSQELPAQAIELVNRLKNPNFGIDMANDWKLITVFIGGNDLCEYCHDSNTHSPANYIAKIQETLDYLHLHVPRAFVNLVNIFDITPLAQVSQGFFCNLVTNMVCDCAKNANNNNMLSVASHLYQEEIRKLVDTGRYDNDDDFVVVLQPFFEDTTPVKNNDGKHDLAYFAPDCFHFSELGTYAAAKSLWNNMIEPVGHKQRQWHLHEPFHCPHSLGHSSGLFRTKKN